jgi:hypothetical protein
MVLSGCHVFPGWHTHLIREVSIEGRNFRGFPVSDFELELRFSGEEMIAMSRMPRVRLVLVAAALLALLVMPIAGARTLGLQSIHPAGSDWIGGVLSWAQNFVGLRQAGHHGRSGPQSPLNQKDTASTNGAQGGSCLDPLGRPRPCY